eukprot:TRINITY_DN2194_c0_g1_i3.p1 TRINITY_DN2194_c0_g1~~TRINITY_DN2194_c0_g1_i3.p1  ORF type:complete len:141 (-),score=27.16 TRINITY_DN2194_c0_g1_i3:103-525(-)
MYTRNATINAHNEQMTREFGPVLQQKMRYHSDVTATALTKLQGKVDTVKDHMFDNMEKVFARADKLEDIEAQTREMNENSLLFKKNTVKQKRKKWWQNKLWGVALCFCCCLLLIVVLYVVAWVVCRDVLLRPCIHGDQVF